MKIEMHDFRERVLNTSALEATIQHLKPSSKYLFRVAAYTDQTLGKESTEVTVQTQTEGEIRSFVCLARAVCFSTD